MRSGASRALIAVAVAAAAFLPFSRAVRYGIVNCDDYDYVRRHIALPKTLSVDGVCKAFTDEVASVHGIWMPLTWISYMMDGSIARAAGLKEADASEFGPSAANVMHVHSLALHGVNAVLLWWLLVMLGRCVWSGEDGRFRGLEAFAALLALFWAMHPLRVESAVWIASRKDVLSAMWMLLALIFWMARRRYWLSMACFAMAAMAKPSVMSFPVLCLIIDVFVVRRIRPVNYVVPVLAAAGLGAFAAQMQAAGGATGDLADVPAWGRLLNAAAAFGMYLKNTIWPLDLAVQCMHRWPALPRFVWPGVALSAVAAWWLGRGLMDVWDRRKEAFRRVPGSVLPEYDFTDVSRPVFAGCLWFAVSIAPMLGLANFGYHAFADRFTYIPAMGLSLAALGLAARWAHAEGRGIKAGILAAVCVALGCCSWRQTGFWRNDRAMWEHTIEVDGEASAVSHASLALYHFEFTHDLDECIRHYRRAFELKPMFVEGTRHLYQFALCEKGLIDEASAELAAAKQWSMKQNDVVADKIRGSNMYMERCKMPPYMLSRIAYFIVAPGMLKAAEEELAAVPAVLKDNVNVWYLQGRLAEAKGDMAAAKSIYGKIVEEGKSTDYVQFRYLARKYGKEGNKVNE